MNLIYIAKNPSPVPQTITIPQGMPLAHGRLYSSESITIEVPPMTQREIRFNEEGKPTRAERFTVTLGGEQDGTEEVAGPLFGLVISQLKPMIPEELDEKLDPGASHIKQSKSRHTERDPDSIKDEICAKCQS